MGHPADCAARRVNRDQPSARHPAIANATGVWIKDLPITAEKILKAVRAKRSLERE